MKKIFLLTFLAVAGASGQAAAGDQAGHPASTASVKAGLPLGRGGAEFDRIKTLAGTWEGNARTGEQPEEKAAAHYKVTAGGSAVVETLFPGTSHEMITVYHPAEDGLAMTHYCMLGNRPHMKLKEADADRLSFEFCPKKSGLRSKKEAHMHSLEIAFTGPDQITETWTCLENGKAKPSTVLTLSRVQ